MLNKSKEKREKNHSNTIVKLEKFQDATFYLLRKAVQRDYCHVLGYSN